MRGHDEIIELLNDVLTAELTAVNQYFLNSRMCANWGYERLAKRHREIAMEEMRDTEELIDRILYLDGHPNLQRLGTVKAGETAIEQIRLASASIVRPWVSRMYCGPAKGRYIDHTKIAP